MDDLLSSILILGAWILLPLLLFAIMAVVMGQILKLLGFKPANKLPDDNGGMWEDDIWNDPTAYQVGGNLYYRGNDPSNSEW